MIPRLALALYTLLLVLPVGAVARPWTLGDLDRVRGVVSVEAGARGDVLYGVASTDTVANEVAVTYYILAPSGRLRRFPFSRQILEVHWSPSGRELAVATTGRDGGSAIDVIDADTLRAVRSLGLRKTLRAFSWSPDGRAFAVVATPSAAASANATSVWLTPQGDVLGTVPRSRQLLVVDARTGVQRRLADDGYSYGGPVTDHPPSWSPDGKRLLAVRQPTGVYGDFDRSEFVMVDVASAKATPLAGPRPLSLPGSIPPQFARDGRVLTVHTWDGTFAAREDLFVDGSDVSGAFDHDFWSCGNSRGEWDGETILASTMDGVDMRLFRFSRSASPVALTPSGGSVLSFSSWKGGVAIAYSTPDHPPELYEITRSGAMRQLTHVNRFPSDLRFAPTTLVNWRSKSGHALVGQLTADPREAALLTEPHGGPQCADDSSFSPFVQYLATNGYAYFRPSVRGSDGYGDWSYKAIVNDFGPGPFDDLLGGVEAARLAAKTPAAASFMYGASYGGYLTAFAVTHSDRFRAAVAAIPVTDVALDYELSESPNITRRFFGNAPLVDNLARMDEQSPISMAQNMQTPLLLMIGLRDTRAPYAQTLAFYRRLVELGKPVRLLAYPNDGHGPGSPRATEDWIAHVAGWFAAHGGPKVPGAMLPPAS